MKFPSSALFFVLFVVTIVSFSFSVNEIPAVSVSKVGFQVREVSFGYYRVNCFWQHFLNFWFVFSMERFSILFLIAKILWEFLFSTNSFSAPQVFLSFAWLNGFSFLFATTKWSVKLPLPSVSHKEGLLLDFLKCRNFSNPIIVWRSVWRLRRYRLWFSIVMPLCISKSVDFFGACEWV